MEQRSMKNPENVHQSLNIWTKGVIKNLKCKRNIIGKTIGILGDNRGLYLSWTNYTLWSEIEVFAVTT